MDGTVGGGGQRTADVADAQSADEIVGGGHGLAVQHRQDAREESVSRAGSVHAGDGDGGGGIYPATREAEASLLAASDEEEGIRFMQGGGLVRRVGLLQGGEGIVHVGVSRKEAEFVLAVLYNIGRCDVSTVGRDGFGGTVKYVCAVVDVKTNAFLVLARQQENGVGHVASSGLAEHEGAKVDDISGGDGGLQGDGVYVIVGRAFAIEAEGTLPIGGKFDKGKRGIAMSILLQAEHIKAAGGGKIGEVITHEVIPYTAAKANRCAEFLKVTRDVERRAAGVTRKSDGAVVTVRTTDHVGQDFSDG